jgi:very-short-patch-repair endonuclease
VALKRGAWARLRGRKVGGWKFRRQQPLGEYFVDFYCPAVRLVIEVDGPRHGDDHQAAYDLRRHAWLEADGCRVVRLPVEYVDQDLDGVIAGIYEELTELAATKVKIYCPTWIFRSAPSPGCARDFPINGEEFLTE